MATTVREPSLGHVEILGHHADNPPEERKTGQTVRGPDGDYVVSSAEHGIRAQMEQWVRKNAEQALLDAHPKLREALTDRYLEKRSTGAYNWPDDFEIVTSGNMIQNSLNETTGALHLFYLLLRRCHKHMTEAKAQAIYIHSPQECKRALAWALGGLAARALEASEAAENGGKKDDGPEPPDAD